MKVFVLNISKILDTIRKWVRSILRDDVHYICGADALPPPLSAQEEEQCISVMCDDENARRTLIEHNLRLVVYIAKKFENTKVGLEDLVSIGTIGLIKAINTFNPEKNIKLATYASRCIENEILMYLRKNHNTKAEVSIDEPLNVDWDGNELLFSDVLGTDDDITSRRMEENTDKQLLSIALHKLSPREKKIMQMRFGLSNTDEKTQKEVADELGISQSYISRLEKRIISKLKKEISRMI